MHRQYIYAYMLFTFLVTIFFAFQLWNMNFECKYQKKGDLVVGCGDVGLEVPPSCVAAAEFQKVCSRYLVSNPGAGTSAPHSDFQRILHPHLHTTLVLYFSV